MPFTARIGAWATLQNAVNTAVDGAALDVGDADGVLVSVTGTFTNINVFFEGSIDAGVTFVAVPVRLPAGTLASSLSPVVVGVYRLEDSRGLTHFRVRTTIGAVTGTVTIRAVPIIN